VLRYIHMEEQEKNKIRNDEMSNVLEMKGKLKWIKQRFQRVHGMEYYILFNRTMSLRRILSGLYKTQLTQILLYVKYPQKEIDAA
jgi:hypothetical protein